jgi:glucose-6-phosphate-specific signal transduction histidine kinase
MADYALVGVVTVLFGLGVWAAFTLGVRRGRAMEQSRADQRIEDTALPALDAIAVFAPTPEAKLVAREYAAVLRRNLERKRKRRLSDDLAGVVAELSWQGMRTRLELGGLDARVDAGLPPERRSALREAIGAALHNTARHSGVHDAEVTVETRDGGVAVTARDSGAGFDMDRGRPGFGIGASIVGRMTEVGGTATIESRPGGGTRVTLWVPA